MVPGASLPWLQLGRVGGFLIFAAGHSLDVVWIACFGVYVFVFLLCRCLLEDAGKRDYCGLNGCVADICDVHAYAVIRMLN